jgi:N utilization substance protein B
MPSRHKSRQHALQALFQIDIRKQTAAEAIAACYSSLYSEEEEDLPPEDPFMEQLVRGTAESMAEIDSRISGRSEHWRLERMPLVDRNILRLAAYEMTYAGTPPPVAIDEALELARRFSGEDSVAFINGVLDAVMRDLAQQAAATGE